MRKEVLISLGVISLLYSSTALSQTCATPPSCESLGFTETEADCSGGKMLKCPFDLSKVFCGKGSSGDGGDAGDAGVDPVDATLGMIYYSDGTISADVIEGKTPVGVVAYNDGSKKLVVALEEKVWGGYEHDVACLSNVSSLDAARLDYQGKANTQCLLSDSQPHPAAEYCNSYKPVTSGKGSSGWYLPAVGELYVMSLSYGRIKLALQKLSKAQISSDLYWSSSEYVGNNAWLINPSTGELSSRNHYPKRLSNPVRCVLAF